MGARIHFSIKYDGPALADHQMDARELAPSLIALSDLIEQANEAAFAGAQEVRLVVQGNFKGGSFGVDLIAVQGMAQQIMSLLSGQEATAASNLSGILSGIGLLGGGGLIGLIKWLRGRKPSVVRTEGDRVVFELVDAEAVESFEVDLIAGKLYQTRAVRQSLAKVLKPLEREGVDVFACGKDGATQAVVTREERSWFEQAASEADVVSDTMRERVLLQIESAVFKDGNKWRFHDGTSAFYAELADTNFLARVDAGAERFGKGDMLVADLRIIQSVGDGGLRQEYRIEKVHEHREPLQPGLI